MQVEQIDRDAAETLFKDVLGNVSSYGEWGYTSYREAAERSMAQAFARHRIAERERVVGEVERLEERMGEAYQLAGSIALEHDISGPEVEQLLDLLAGSEAKFGGRD